MTSQRTLARAGPPAFLLGLLLLSLASRASAASCPGGCTKYKQSCPYHCKAKKDCDRQEEYPEYVCQNGSCHWEKRKRWVRGWKCRQRTCRAACTKQKPACDAIHCFRVPCGPINGKNAWYCDWKKNVCTPDNITCPPGSGWKMCTGPPTPTRRCAHNQANGVSGPGSNFAAPSGTQSGQMPTGGKNPGGDKKLTSGAKPKGGTKPVVPGKPKRPGRNPNVGKKPTAHKKLKVGQKAKLRKE